jgi:membrane-associated phospholipid phosphatase
MAKNSTRSKALIFGAAFAVFSGAVAFGWLYEADLWFLRTAQEHPSGNLKAVFSIFSLLGGLEVAGVALLVLLAGLFLRGRRALAKRLIVAFVVTGIVELVMKLYLPQVLVPEGIERAEDFAPLVALDFPYPYPSGHMLRSVILLGALYPLSKDRLSRAGIVLVLMGIAASRVYLGAHWASDVVGGALLRIVGVLWAFGKEDRWLRSQ